MTKSDGGRGVDQKLAKYDVGEGVLDFSDQQYCWSLFHTIKGEVSQKVIKSDGGEEG